MVSSVTPECDSGARIEAGLRHQIASDAVGLALVGAAVGQQQSVLGADAQGSVLETPRLLGEQIHQHQPALDRQLLGQALVGLIRQRMRDLVSDDGGARCTDCCRSTGKSRIARRHVRLSSGCRAESAGLASGGGCRDHLTWNLDNNHANRSAFMPESDTLFAEPLETCSMKPRAGFTCCGNGETPLQAIGSHTVCDRADLTCHPVDLS